MKKIIFLFCLTPSLTFAQGYPTVEFVDVKPKEIGLSESKLKEFQDLSRKHAMSTLGAQTPDSLELKSVQIVMPKTTLYPPVPIARDVKTALVGLGNIDSPAPELPCGEGGPKAPFAASSSPLSQHVLDNHKILQKIDDQYLKDKKYNAGMIYFIWGYNRAIHSTSDATFKTRDGTFTIKNAKGHDRPSPDFDTYYKWDTISIPQFNVRLGYQITPKWSIEVGEDHMKWVFQNKLKYDIEGNYDHVVNVDKGSGGTESISFEEAKKRGDASWLSFDHTNGFNYVFVSTMYKHNLFTSKNEKFKLDAMGGAGLGVFIPQTSVWINQDVPPQWVGKDNQFHLAGYGGDVEGRLRMTYGKVFAEATTRGTLIKIENALVNREGERLEHTPIASLEFIVDMGVNIPIVHKKQKRVPKTE